MFPPIVDTHCHLHLYPDAGSVAQRCIERGIRVHVMTVRPAEYDKLLASAPAGDVHPALGLYPDDVAACEAALPAFLERLPGTRLVGEVGLDYVTESEDERVRQRRVFERILAASAESGDKLISIHSRRASADVIAAIGRDYPGMPVLHWFSGQVREIEAADPGIYFSINTAMTSSRRGTELIRAMNPERILTETDGPYIQLGPRPAEPGDLRQVFDGLGRIWDVTAEEAAAQVYKNFLQTLGNKC